MKKFLTLLFIILGCMSYAKVKTIPFVDENGVKIAKYTVEIPQKFAIPAAINAFKNGITPGIGSGITFAGIDQQGAYLFYCITDRGPNGDSPDIITGNQEKPTKIFATPDFTPSIGIIRIEGSDAKMVKILPIKSTDGKKISGRPIPEGQIGSTKEIPLDGNLQVIATDKEGMDTEGIYYDGNSSFWICDEYGPFIAQIDAKSGKILKKLAPGNGLPEIVAKRQANRGFEGVAVTKNGKVYGAVQSILDFGNVKKSKALFTRLVEYDRATGKTKMFGYPIDTSVYKKSADAKIGDLVALNDHEFLIVEQGSSKAKKIRNVIYKIDIARATDLGAWESTNGKVPEELSSDDLNKAGITLISKELVLDLNSVGWTPEKAEGLTVIDNKTIAVSSDSDFGMAIQVKNPAKDSDGKEVTDPTEYLIKDGKLYYKDAPVETQFAIIPSEEGNTLWMITLDKTLY